MSPVLDTMARQSAQLRDDVNRAPVFVPVPQPVAGGTGEPKEKTMADNRPMVKLREHLLGLGGKETPFEIGGQKYLLVAPSEKKASQIQQAALKVSVKTGPDGQPERNPETGKPTGAMDFNMDQLELKVRALIACAFDPETRRPIFAQNDPTEVEALCGATVSGTRRKLMEACVELLTPNLEQVEKNSSATPDASTSSASP